MRLLWISDSPDSPSGFGMVTRAICPRLVRQGHEIEILGWQQRSSAAYWEGIPIRPVRHDTFGADVLHGYLMRFQPQIVVTLADIWWMSFMADPGIQRYLDQARARWLLYFPVDGASPGGDLPPGWKNLLETADMPVAMSRFGQEVAAACGVPVDYIPHGCEIEIFRPPKDRAEAKQRLGYEGRFLVLSDARNQPRKLLPRLLDIAARLCQKHPEVAFHLHTDPDDSASRSELYNYRLREDIQLLGLEDQVGLTAGHQMRRGAGLSLEQLASLYQAADCHLLTSWGEGFGLPTLQAASCGTVPIAVDYTANRELLGDHGLPVPAESTLIDEFGIERRLIDRDAAVEAIESLIADPDALAGRSRRSREFALGYGWDTIGDRWGEVIASAPARRTPTGGYQFEWGGVSRTAAESDVPDSVADVTDEVMSRLPEGAQVSFKLSEHQLGAAQAAIRTDSFRKGDYVSVPVRLPPAFEGAPRATIGHLLVAPADLKLIPALQRIFPGIAVSLPTPPDNPIEGRMLEIEELVPILPHYVLVADYQRQATGLDVVCAILGVPFIGPSQVWSPLDGSPLAQLRQLLTDQGLSSARRSAAMTAVEQAVDGEVIEQVRSLCLAGQPEPVAAPRAEEGPEIETVIIRLADQGERQAVISATKARGGVLMMASAQSLVAAIPVDAKEALEEHPGVEHIGGVSLDEESGGAEALKKSFANFAAKQLSESLESDWESG